MEKLSNNIVKLRIMNGLSQDDLAEKVGVTRQTIYKWEKNESCPKGNNLKLLCEIFEVTMEQLLGKKPLILDKKIELAIDELKTDLKQEDETKKTKIKKLIKRLLKCLIILVAVLVLTYASCTAYKFIVLTNIGNQVSKYETLDNYYCEIKTYNNRNLQQKKIIWYKEQKYKIEDIDFNNVGEITNKSITIINLENNTKEVYYDDNKEGRTRELNDVEKYTNGRYMYNLFPEIIKNDTKVKIDNSFKINSFEFNNSEEYKDTHQLTINKMQVNLNKGTYIPVFYTNGDNGDNIKQNFAIELNNVNDEDLNV